MNMSAQTDWLKKIDLKDGRYLYAACMAAFFTQALGTSPMTISGILIVLCWIFGQHYKQLKDIAAAPWFPAAALFMVLPVFGLIYTPDFKDLGLCYAEKTHYWLYGLGAASLAFTRFPARYLIYAFLAGLTLNALIGLLQFAGIWPLVDGQFRGFGEGYNTLSAFLIIGI